MRDKRGKVQELLTRDGRGCGGFLDPPDYPTHTYVIITDLNRRPENRGHMSVEVDERDREWVEPSVVAQADRLIKAWRENPPAVDRDDVREWRLQVLGYFRNCYRGTDAGPYNRGEWAAESLVIDRGRDPREDPAEHAGVNHIRRFYPDYTPTQEDWEQAHWGEKVSA